MEVLEKEEINPELAEIILDKVHLAMSKENPDWQDWAMDEEGEEWKEVELNSLSRKCFLRVLKNSSKELTSEAGKKLAKEFKALGAKFLSDFLFERTEFQNENEEEKIQTDKSVSSGPFLNILKSNPTPSPIRAGNYKKSRQKVQGIPILIENKKGELKNPKLEFLKSRLLDVKKSLSSLPGFLENKVSGQKFLEIQKSNPFQTSLSFHNEGENNEIRKAVEKSNRELLSLKKAGRGRPAAQIGTTNLWDDGRFHEKTSNGWKVVKKPKNEPNQNPPKKERKPRKKKIERPKSGQTNPTRLPFSKIRVVSQYTKKEDYDRTQIETLKQKIFKNGYDPSFPMTIDFKDGQWTVVAGHHRYEAVKELIAEGKISANFEIPVVTKRFADENSRLAAQISENHRRNVLPTDEAIAYGKLVKDGWDIKRISEELGIKQGEIQKRLALNNLSPELFRLVHKKDRSLPLGIAEVIGTFCKDANDKPNSTMQLKAFRWYQENRSKYGSRGPSVLQNYIKELQSGEFENFDFDSVATNVQKEALRTIGSKEKASANKKMLEVMVENLMKTYNRVLGDNITSLSPDVTKELAASLALTSDKGVDSVAILGKLGVIIQDLTLIKNSIQSKLKEIEDDSSIPMLFARSFLVDIEEAIELSNVLKSETVT
ncbi:ParB/RepB/Spo0J family partition protein [Leptospira weilii]|uniref:ParB-like protein n=1 Tax=Leptospira weilii str. UI 13098 TaxID=1088542 RepID=M6Q2V4_9LEPT|nr:ParB/RepB/Spo0J family partition protein [Leptospira weilii]EMN89896.1 ParB-like protein [Leptospira weilii str. UI 13098]